MELVQFKLFLGKMLLFICGSTILLNMLFVPLIDIQSDQSKDDVAKFVALGVSLVMRI